MKGLDATIDSGCVSLCTCAVGVLEKAHAQETIPMFGEIDTSCFKPTLLKVNGVFEKSQVA
jgi:hypothetical protein